MHPASWRQLDSYEGHPENKECLRTQSELLFCCSRSLVSGVQCDVENWLMQLYVGPCHVISAEIAVAMAADWEFRRLWGARCYSFSAGRWDLRLSSRRGQISRGIVLLHDNALSHTARQRQTLLRELFHWNIFEHPPYSSDLAPYDFSCFQKWRSTLLVNASQMMKIWRMLSLATWYEEGIHKLVPWYDKCLNVKGDYVE